jgi:PAS domain S-box-containing protein
MLQLSLSAHPSSAAEARRFAADVLREWEEDPLSDAVVLLVSELVTNAVLHAGSPVQVALRRRGGRVHVDVADESPVMPGIRDYGDEATTGRGLELVELLTEDWGVEPRQPRGKTVWFELPSTQEPPEAEDADPVVLREVSLDTPDVDAVRVRLLGAPVRLFPAMQQHTDALLREYALIAMESSESTAPPRLAVDLNPLADQVTAATVAGNMTTELLLDVPVAARGSVLEVCDVLDRADALAANGRLLNTPPLPEVRGCRDWFFSQLLTQIDGGDPDPWVVTMATDEAPTSADIDFRTLLDELDDAVVVADDRNHLLYANAAVEQVLGWSPDELVGRRLTTIIPKRLHEAHVAGYTRFLVTHEARLIGNPVRVPALRHDGTEVEVQLTLQTFRPPGARQMFIGVLHLPDGPVTAQTHDHPAGHRTALQALDELGAQLDAGMRDRAEVLALLGKGLDRQFGAWWVVDGDVLRCGAVWEAEPGRYDTFRHATQQRRFAPGQGLPGRVWSSGTPEWLPDVVADANFPRVGLVVQHKLRTACAFPVVGAGRVDGVVELFATAIQPRDPALLQALITAGRLLGLAGV